MTISDAETDLGIIKAIQQGNREAFAELYDQHNAWLMALAYRILQNQRDAEDLLHDVFVEIWKKAASYEPKRGTVRSWLAIKIRSRALDRIRMLKTIKKHIVEQPAIEIEFQTTTLETEIICSIEHSEARKLLEKLTPVQRDVIELSYFRGFTCQEIANHCQLPLGTVKSGLLRAIKVLRKEFNSNMEADTCL